MKRSPIKSRSPSRRRTLELACDDLWRTAIRLMWMQRCAKCGRQGHDAHHIIRCGNKNHRHSLMNGIYLCADHHVPYAHNFPEAFMEWLKEKWPAYYAWHVEHEGDSPERVSVVHLEATRADLKQIIQRMREECHAGIN